MGSADATLQTVDVTLAMSFGTREYFLALYRAPHARFGALVIGSNRETAFLVKTTKWLERKRPRECTVQPKQNFTPPPSAASRHTKPPTQQLRSTGALR